MSDVTAVADPPVELTALQRAQAAVGATKVVDATTGITTNVEGVQPDESAVPAAARATLKDRLKKREVATALAVLDEDTVLKVTGLRSGQMDELRNMAKGDDGEGDDPDNVNISRSQARMFEAMVTDPETNEKVFEGWSEEEFAEFPLRDAAIILRAIAAVNGQTTEPGKGSPSTPGDASSSQ